MKGTYEVNLTPGNRPGTDFGLLHPDRMEDRVYGEPNQARSTGGVRGRCICKTGRPPGGAGGYVPFFQFSGRSDLTAAPARHISEFRHAPSSTSSFSR